MRAGLTAAELEARLAAEFPEAFHPGSGLTIVEAGPRTARVRLVPAEKSTRPGGTISGPTLMMLADVTMYIALLASIGWVPLAVTTNLNINFLKKPVPGALLADCQILKLGKRLAVGSVTICAPGDDEPVAHATSTYSIPPHRK
ncbi:MAG TPA: PaaI family thioesterase [Xanthobacteraceae bacterium]|nr:PaaI family thioesterase [Xanthobacteraceae bacterium]